VVTTIAGTANQSGSQDGTGSDARLNGPWGIAFDNTSNIYIAESVGNTIRRVSSEAIVTTIAGKPAEIGSVDGVGDTARFTRPYGISGVLFGHAEGFSDILVADAVNHQIRQVSRTGVVRTLTGKPPITGSADGVGNEARFASPIGIEPDKDGSLVIGDAGNRLIRKIAPNGRVTTIAGKAGVSGSVDGSASDARFINPGAIAVSADGFIFVGDDTTIRKISPSGTVSLFAGANGSSGSIDGPRDLARFGVIGDIVVDRDGTLVVSDVANHTIRKIDKQGMVSTLAGMTGQSGSSNGFRQAARFSLPIGLAVDQKGNLYVADTGNHTIRKITLDGDVTTVSGAAGVSGSSDGDAQSARYNVPRNIAFDDLGNAYITDSNNGTVRKLDSQGIVRTIAGVAGQIGFPTDASLPSKLWQPRDITFYRGNLYVTMNNGIVAIIDAP
jgi:sugar lactone lactonase YvrE